MPILLSKYGDCKAYRTGVIIFYHSQVISHWWRIISLQFSLNLIAVTYLSLCLNLDIDEKKF